MNVLSLFDGMGCARLALGRAGIHVDHYFASETDDFAMKIVKKNYPDTIFVGDVTKLRGTQFPKIDLIIGGPPCQDLSIASHTQAGLSGERSRLFFEYARLLGEIKPKWWFMENVKSMKKADRNIINKTLGCPPIEMNSSLVSAQHRKRLYWTNAPFDVFFDVPQDKMLILRDILEDSAWTEREKSFAIDAGYFKSGNIAWYLKKNRRQLVFRDRRCYQVAVAELNGNDICKRIYSEDGLSPSLPTGGSGNTIPKVLLHGVPQCYRVYSEEGLSPSLTANAGPKNDIPKIEVGYRGHRSGRVYSVDGLGLAVRGSSGSDTIQKIEWLGGEKNKWRKLTPIECERLQTVPDNYTDGVSNTQRYKMLGNGFTVDVMAHLLGLIPKAKVIPIAEARKLFA